MSKSAAGYINKILDPLLAKRAGVSTALITAWAEIVGGDLAEISMPIKVRWPNRSSEDDALQPGTLLVAAEGMAALHIQHQTGEVIDRVNAFMGYRAIDRIRLIQKPVEKKKPKKRLKPITEGEKRKIDKLAEGIEDEALKESLRRFGQSVMRDKK